MSIGLGCVHVEPDLSSMQFVLLVLLVVVRADLVDVLHSVAQRPIYPDSTMAQTGVSGPVVVEGESFSDALFASAG